MSRWISFFVLLGVIVIIAAFFIRVMAEFLVPLFVATLLVVIFRPVHLWFLEKTNQRPAWSALLTTITVFLAVVMPFGIMLALAAAEGREIVKRFDKSQILQKLDDFRSTFGLNVSHLDQLSSMEATLNSLRDSIDNQEQGTGILTPRHFSEAERQELSEVLDRMIVESQRLGVEYGLPWPPESLADESETPLTEPGSETGEKETDARQTKALTEPTSEGNEIGDSTADRVTTDPPENAAAEDETAQSQQDDETTSSFLQLPFTAFGTSSPEPSDRLMGSNAKEQNWFNFVYTLRDTLKLAKDPQWQPDVSENRPLEWQLRAAVSDSHARFRDFKIHLMGGALTAWFKELVNPQDDDVERYSETVFHFVRNNFVTWGGTATVFLGRLLFGGVIAIVSVYFFLLDGPAMMASVMQLSPMDDRHEKELIDEFERVSRAVVLATLVAAVVQGLLAGIGFYFAGIQSVFLLMMLTMLLAMIPFFGAASVWVPVVLYVAFFENHPFVAFFLFLYCALIVSTIDNVIKPYILHGQSNLHPLLALLSVLGGVTALGAIGIMVGPMLVAFLQTLLKILRDELVTLDGSFQGRSPMATALAGLTDAGQADAGQAAIDNAATGNGDETGKAAGPKPDASAGDNAESTNTGQPLPTPQKGNVEVDSPTTVDLKSQKTGNHRSQRSASKKKRK